MNYVYKIINNNNIVEYIGETKMPKTRFRLHKTKNNLFEGRDDVRMELVKSFKTRKEAYDYQCELQEQYGFVTDKEKNNYATSVMNNPIYNKDKSIGAKKAGLIAKETGQIQKLGKSMLGIPKTIQHCNNLRIAQLNLPSETCPYCGLSSRKNMKRYHFENCKLKNI